MGQFEKGDVVRLAYIDQYDHERGISLGDKGRVVDSGKESDGAEGFVLVDFFSEGKRIMYNFQLVKSAILAGEDSVEELTLEEVCEELGREIKIIK